MTKAIIFLSAFCSIGILAYCGIPSLLRHYSQIQKRQADAMAKQLHQMFIFTEKRHLLLMFTLIPLVLGILGFLLLGNPAGFLLGLVFGSILPTFWVRQMPARRRNAFANQLVDGLMLLSSSLRAGMSLNQGFEVLVEELPPPISDEFSLVIKENQMGIALEECLAHLKNRMPVDDLDLIITAINIARETGGNLTGIIGHLVFTIREKKKLEDRVKALTVQGRLQGVIMGLLPIAFAVFIYFVNPDNLKIMLEDSLGQALLIWAVISEVIGIFLIRKLSKVEV